MISLEKWTVYGFKEAIRGMRNPMNSWDKSDSVYHCMYTDDCIMYPECSNCPDNYGPASDILVGQNDYNLMKKLAEAGTDHGKFMRFLQAYIDITAPLFFWKQFMTYRMGVEVNSCSTMHTICKRPLTIDDFTIRGATNEYCDLIEETIIPQLNKWIEQYNNYEPSDGVKDQVSKVQLFRSIIGLLPDSYNQKRSCVISYAALRNMYHARKHHKLDEWHQFCSWIETLPYSELITGELDQKDEEDHEVIQ